MGGSHACAVDDSGVKCWGREDHGQLLPPAGLDGITDIQSGNYFSCALENGGKLSCWGDNSFGQADVPEGLK